MLITGPYGSCIVTSNTPTSQYPKIIDLKEHYKPVQIETKIKNRIQHLILIVEKEILNDNFFASQV